MNETELLYSYSSIAIASALFISMIIFNEGGYRVGRFVQVNTDTEVKALTGAIQGSILGLLALLLGFTFSMSMQRFDNRSMALIDEANKIRTAILKVQLLPAEHAPKALSLLDEYIEQRVQIGKLDLTKFEQRKQYNQKITQLQNELWALAIVASETNPVSMGTFINTLNDMFDSQGKRNALIQMHVPEVILLLLFTVFISAGGILGYSSGLAGKRVLMPIILVSLLITLIVFIIIDLDRPKRGFIQVNQNVLSELVHYILPNSIEFKAENINK